MTASDRDQAWEDWLPTVEGAELEHFKWAWCEAEGELVWRVSGPADGRPAHEEQIREAWGRGPRLAAGDVFGAADYADGQSGERAHLSIWTYYGGEVPKAIVHWFSEAFPEAEVVARANPGVTKP